MTCSVFDVVGQNSLMLCTFVETPDKIPANSFIALHLSHFWWVYASFSTRLLVDHVDGLFESGKASKFCVFWIVSYFLTCNSIAG